jgi:hypothetical protein
MDKDDRSGGDCSGEMRVDCRIVLSRLARHPENESFPTALRPRFQDRRYDLMTGCQGLAAVTTRRQDPMDETAICSRFSSRSRRRAREKAARAHDYIIRRAAPAQDPIALPVGRAPQRQTDKFP